MLEVKFYKLPILSRLCIILLITSSIFTTKVFAQDYGNKVDPLKLCIAIQANNFISDAEAENALDRILSVIGASKRFVLQPCDNINNAVAISYKGVRYILYDKEFMNSISSGGNWGNLFILAHEVGHHVNGHSLDLVLYAAEAVEAETLASKRQQELEADEFAGFVLGKLGASLQQTSQAVNLLATNNDDTYSSHPSKSKRIFAISEGHRKALNKGGNYQGISSNFEIAEEFYKSGINKGKRRDYYGAIADFTKSIELNPSHAKTYYNRGYSKFNLNDDLGAISDYTIAIDLNPYDAQSYFNRGYSKANLNDFYGAISDYSRFLEFDPDYSAYLNRGVAKFNLNDFNGAIADYAKSIELNPSHAPTYYNRGLAKISLGEFYDAIFDFNKAIELNPNHAQAYLNRGIAKVNFGDLNGACKDARKAKELGNELADELINYSCY